MATEGGDISRLADEARRAFDPGAAEVRRKVALESVGGFLKKGVDALGHAAGGAAHIPIGGVKATVGIVGKSAELGRSGGEALFHKMGEALEHRQAFGRSVARFALHGAGRGALRYSAKELAKSVVVWSGMAGAVGGGLTGTLVAGAFVGAASGALVEYARQVNQNLDREADSSLAGRKAAFLLKFKELRHAEVLKPNDLRKIEKAAIFGAVAGAGAGELVKYVPQLSEFVSEHAGGLKEFFSGAKDLGSFPGVHGVQNLVGEAGILSEEAKSLAATLPGAQGAKDLAGGGRDIAGGVWNSVAQATDDLKHAVGLGDSHESVQEVVNKTPGSFANESSDLPPAGIELHSPEEVARAAAEAKAQAVHALTNNHEVLQSEAAIVGEHLNETNQIVDSILQANDINPAQIPAEVYENARMSVQHQMEELANKSFTQAAEAVSDTDTSHLGVVITQGRNVFVNSLADEDVHNKLMQSAFAPLKEHVNMQLEVFSQVNTALAPDSVTEVAMNQGASVGQALVDHGYSLTWGAADADVLTAHVAANYYQLDEMWGRMAAVDNLPAGIHFPLSLTEISELNEKARNGDAVALQKLKDALHWVPQDQKFKILNKDGVVNVLDVLKKIKH